MRCYEFYTFYLKHPNDCELSVSGEHYVNKFIEVMRKLDIKFDGTPDDKLRFLHLQREQGLTEKKVMNIPAKEIQLVEKCIPAIFFKPAKELLKSAVKPRGVDKVECDLLKISRGIRLLAGRRDPDGKCGKCELKGDCKKIKGFIDKLYPEVA